MKTLKDVLDAAKSIGKYSSVENVHIIEHTETACRFKLYTDNNVYSINARVGDRTYLGCVANSRKPRAGEDWTRGNDLADGDLSIDTWNNILADIIGYELVRVHNHV